MGTDVSEKPAPAIFMETWTILWFSVQVPTVRCKSVLSLGCPADADSGSLSSTTTRRAELRVYWVCSWEFLVCLQYTLEFQNNKIIL